MHDLVHISKCDILILESSGMCQGVKEPQRSLMVMSETHDSSKPLEPNQIWFLTYNLSIYMVALDVDPHLIFFTIPCVIFQYFKISLMTESTSLLQCFHLHEHLLHPTQVGSFRLSCNHGTVKLIISKNVFVCNHTYRMFSLMINSLVFLLMLHFKYAHSSHKKSPCVMTSTQAITRINFL